MTTNVPAATREVWIEGDVDSYMVCRVFDAATKQRINTVQEMELSVCEAAYSMANLTHKDGRVETVEVVPRPKHPLAGKRVVLWSLEQEHDAVRAATLILSSAKVREVDDDGRLGNVVDQHHCSRSISDVKLAQVKDPENLLSWHAGTACQDVAFSIYSPLITAMVAASPSSLTPSKGGRIVKFVQDDIGKAVVVNQDGWATITGYLDQLIDDPAGQIAVVRCTTGGISSWRGGAKLVELIPNLSGPLATCDECEGKGVVELFNGPVPCSKGCTP